MTSFIELCTALRKALEILLPKTEVSKEDALTMTVLYPKWEPNTHYTMPYKVKHNGTLYEIRQEHTSQAQYPPDSIGVESLYTVIDESHAGTLSDPIPYDGNMKLEEGKHYVQDGITYQCTRDSGIALTHPLSALVGLYVIAVEA